MDGLSPPVLVQLGPVGLTESALTSLGVSAGLVIAMIVLLRWDPARETLEVVYEFLETSLQDMVTVDVTELVPLILTQWLFILTANLAGLLPVLDSPTADLSVTAALAVVSFLAGHVYAFRARGLAYLQHYLRPSPLLLPFNIIGEASRTIALALRLFGNILSGEIVVAVLLSLVGLLVPVPLMLLGVLTGAVQAYIFGVLTLVFTASSMQVAAHAAAEPEPETHEVAP